MQGDMWYQMDKAVAECQLNFVSLACMQQLYGVDLVDKTLSNAKLYPEDLLFYKKILDLYGWGEVR